MENFRRLENDVDFLAFVPDFMDDFEDLSDLADEVLDIEAMVVLIVELDRPCPGSMSASAVPVSIMLGWVITGSTGVAGISLTWGCGPGAGLIVTREVGRGEDSLMSGPALLGILSPLPHAVT